MIDGLPLSFFLPLVVHALAGMSTGIVGVVVFGAPKYSRRHPQWGARYLLGYTLVFVTATVLALEHLAADMYLLVLAVMGYGCALGARAAQWLRKRRAEPWWIVVHILGMIGSYVILWTAFLVDNAHLIPLLKQLPTLTFWILPPLAALPFLAVSAYRFAPHTLAPARQASAAEKEDAV